MKIHAISFTNGQVQNQKQNVEKKENYFSTLSTAEKVYAGLSAAGIAGLTILTIAQKKKLNALKNLPKSQTTEVISQGIAELLPYKVTSLSENKLYKEFQKSKDNFVNFLTNSTEKPQEIKNFLFAVTADEKVGVDFVKEVIADPRQTIPNLKLLNNKIGGQQNLLEWLQAPKGYNDAYGRYIEEVLANPKHTPEDLLSISPNWFIRELSYNHNIEGIAFGTKPKDFEKIQDYSHFVNWLNDMPFDQADPKMLEYGGNYMKVSPLSGGLSGKRNFIIQFQDNPDKKYVLKAQMGWGCDTPYAKENLCYKSDSAFMNAQMDYYLSHHNCENAAKFHYYDYKSNSGLYDFQDGVKVEGVENIIDANKRLPDMNKLGIYYNDACSCNFIEKDGILKVIDIGDSSFIDPLRPGAKGHNLQTPNWCGVGLPNLSMMLKD